MKIFKRLSSFRLIILGFACLIFIGALLLMLPVSSAKGEVSKFSDCLFTATSAACVTGLITVDTATHWSAFGQTIIIVLIQIGGLGVVSIGALMTVVSGKKLSLSQRNTVQESVNAPRLGGIIRLTLFSLKVTIVIEALGALALMPIFIPEFGLKGIWYSVFHSISAFCNAGFDLMGVQAPFSSLSAYSANAAVCSVIMLLIIFGGLGFLTWGDFLTHKFRFKRYSLQSKVILVTSLLLLILPSIYFFAFEFKDLPMGERIISSLFQSVTARTAGFNTQDQAALAPASIVLMVVLMLIGGSPGSTAGGMKTTTFSLCIGTSMSVFKRKNSVGFFGRRIADDTVRCATAILMLYIALFLLSGCAISLIEDLPMSACLYETASALGTVGITLGITTSLSLPSQIILMCLMFLGRVGGLTLIYAAIYKNKADLTKYPIERIAIG